MIQTSAHLSPAIGGAQISVASYNTSSWLPTSMPTTVMAALVENGVYQDPFYSLNLESVPTSQFNVSWWFRTTFDQPPSTTKTSSTRIRFNGLNYRANIWCNGAMLASTSTAVGSFVYFEYDVSRLLQTSDNVLAVELYQPWDTWTPSDNNSTDLAISFVDWAPFAPDMSMGLWRGVSLISLPSSISLDYPLVATRLSSSSTGMAANLTLMVQVSNFASTAVTGTLMASIDGIGSFSQSVTMLPYQIKQVFFEPSAQYANLTVANPQLWWPWQMGQPVLHNVTFSFMQSVAQWSKRYGRRSLQHVPITMVDDADSNNLNLKRNNLNLNLNRNNLNLNLNRNNLNLNNSRRSGDMVLLANITSSFGIRQITSQLDARQHRLYSINGKPLMIRGAGWAPDLFLRAPRQRLEAEMAYVRHMNLNAIRLEGKMEDDTFFDIADRMGLLVMPGWCCCDAWQHWTAWDSEQYHVAIESMRSQLRRLRIHASVLVFMYSSDDMPPERVELEYLMVAKQEHWPNPLLSSASDLTSSITGPTGVKMSGPYSWEPPNYWYASVYGGAFSFLTEGGPGENPMTLESFQRTIPLEAQWPINYEWSYHCGNQNGVFRDLRFFTPPLNARFGNATSASDYLLKSQAQAYESHRAMFEAYNRNKYNSTGVIQWMLNNAFPQMIWHLYDYYLNTGGAYFATKLANEPLHLLYSYDEHDSIWLVNSLYSDASLVNASASVYRLDGTNVYRNSMLLPHVPADATMPLFSLPSIANLTSTYFVRLLLTNATDGQELSKSTYWLSTKSDVLQWDLTTFYRTPCKSYADYTALETLPPVELEASIATMYLSPKDNATMVVVINAANPTNAVAFFVRFRLLRSSDNADLMPALWSDNYITFLPYEKTTITVEFKATELQSSYAELVVEVWNNLVGK
jgi:exo-1,4-beta-D-glucosaminidase